MVLFENIKLNQHVQVNLEGKVLKGKVRYKGPVVCHKGEWVGVELEHNYSGHNGLYLGRRYFQCKEGHGIFVLAENIRFLSKPRCLYDRYHLASPLLSDDLCLFESPRTSVSTDEDLLKVVKLDPTYLERIRRSFPESRQLYGAPSDYHRPHCIGRMYRSPSSPPHKEDGQRRPQTAYGRLFAADPIPELSQTAEPSSSHIQFSTPPSIPKTHMPHDALVKQVKKGWSGAHYVREMTVYNGREKMKFAQWNCI